jgi:hypothetical protein
VVAQEAHGFPLGYGLVPVGGRKRKLRRDGRRILGESVSSSPPDSPISMSELDSSGDSSMMMTPSLSPPSSSTTHRDDEFMNEETYALELMMIWIGWLVLVVVLVD